MPWPWIRLRGGGHEGGALTRYSFLEGDGRYPVYLSQNSSQTKADADTWDNPGNPTANFVASGNRMKH